MCSVSNKLLKLKKNSLITKNVLQALDTSKKYYLYKTLLSRRSDLYTGVCQINNFKKIKILLILRRYHDFFYYALNIFVFF